MIKNVLSDIGGVGLYGIASICLFFVVFIGMLIWVFRMNKSFAQEMSACPLRDGEIPGSAPQPTHSVANLPGGASSETTAGAAPELRATTHLEAGARKGHSHE